MQKNQVENNNKDNEKKTKNIVKELKEKTKAKKADEIAELSQTKLQKKQLKIEIKTINKLNKTPKGKRDLPNKDKQTLIDLHAVEKVYSSRFATYRALNNVNLSIEDGEFVVILGPSGSGKTTLLNIISGLDRPTYGEAIIEGRNIAALTDKELTKFRRDNVGFIFQSYNLLSSLNVIDNIEIGRSLQTNNAKRMDVKVLLQSIGMLGKEKKRIYELSGGQQQRVSIARALSKNPRILIGDEPTGALDQNTSKSVLKIFQNINKNFKTTIIIVTHNEEIASLATKVVKVIDGRIADVIVQTPTELRGA